jgi:hypothetical protein
MKEVFNSSHADTHVQVPYIRRRNTSYHRSKGIEGTKIPLLFNIPLLPNMPLMHIFFFTSLSTHKCILGLNDMEVEKLQHIYSLRAKQWLTNMAFDYGKMNSHLRIISAPNIFINFEEI